MTIELRCTVLYEESSEQDKREVLGLHMRFYSLIIEDPASDRIPLAKLAGILLILPELNLRVEGHTDSTGSAEHNQRLPHSAFRGQTPDEMYFGGGEDVPTVLETAKRAARQARLEANRSLSCPICDPDP